MGGRPIRNPARSFENNAENLGSGGLVQVPEKADFAGKMEHSPVLFQRHSWQGRGGKKPHGLHAFAVPIEGIKIPSSTRRGVPFIVSVASPLTQEGFKTGVFPKPIHAESGPLGEKDLRERSLVFRRDLVFKSPHGLTVFFDHGGPSGDLKPSALFFSGAWKRREFTPRYFVHRPGHRRNRRVTFPRSADDSGI